MDNLQVELLSDKIAKLYWADGNQEVSSDFDTYRLDFRKADTQYNWHLHDTDNTNQKLVHAGTHRHLFTWQPQIVYSSGN